MRLTNETIKKLSGLGYLSKWLVPGYKYIIPDGELVYQCLGCQREFGIEELLYVCPECGQVFLIVDKKNGRLHKISGELWREIFDYRKLLNIPALKGVFLYHEFIAPSIPLKAVVYLGEGHTPIVEANPVLQKMAGIKFYFKNDGQNPSASFKDRGMACALSYVNCLIQQGKVSDVLAICASTGDTSAAAALYASYIPGVKSAVLLPHKKVTPQQLSQPLGSGAAVLEIPGVFDDCMKVVEWLSERYNVALVNSKNAWRGVGQESYSYEIAQDFDYVIADKVVVVPIGNAGNITAVMSGFIKFFKAGIITTLPKIIGVQSEHANPVYRYYLEPNSEKRKYKPVNVRASVAQAAMIGNPVSMPRIIYLVDIYNQLSGKQNVFFVDASEQAIMDWGIIARRYGHINCTQGGESLAGIVEAIKQGLVNPKNEVAILDSTAHALKFSDFQNMYFEDRFPSEYGIEIKKSLINAPCLVKPKDLNKFPAPGKPLKGKALNEFVIQTGTEIAKKLRLSPK